MCVLAVTYYNIIFRPYCFQSRLVNEFGVRIRRTGLKYYYYHYYYKRTYVQVRIAV